MTCVEGTSAEMQVLLLCFPAYIDLKIATVMHFRSSTTANTTKIFCIKILSSSIYSRTMFMQACARMKPAQSKMAADAKQLLPRVLQEITGTGGDGHQFAGVCRKL